MGTAFLMGQNGALPRKFSMTSELSNRHVRLGINAQNVELSHEGERYYVVASTGDCETGTPEFAYAFTINDAEASSFDCNSPGQHGAVIVMLKAVKKGSGYDLCKMSDGSVVVSGVTDLSLNSQYSNKGTYLSVTSFAPWA